MKSASMVLALIALPLGAQAGFDPTQDFTCRSAEGRKVLANDEFSGPGRALVSGHSGELHLHPVPLDGGIINVILRSGDRSVGAEFTLTLNTSEQEITSRKEGREAARYFFVPASLTSHNFWSGDQTVSVKCFQRVN